MNIFKKQAEFMAAGEVKFPDDSYKAKSLCHRLIKEEYREYVNELSFCVDDKPSWSELKEVCDLMVVCSQKLVTDVGPEKAQALLEAVMSNNMSKCIDGKLVKREDGKILKPDGFDKMGWMVDFEGILNER